MPYQDYKLYINQDLEGCCSCLPKRIYFLQAKLIMKTPNNIDKAIPGRGNNEATKEILLAVDKEKLEFDAMNDILDTLMEEFKKEAKSRGLSKQDCSSIISEKLCFINI